MLVVVGSDLIAITQSDSARLTMAFALVRHMACWASENDGELSQSWEDKGGCGSRKAVFRGGDFPQLGER